MKNLPLWQHKKTQTAKAADNPKPENTGDVWNWELEPPTWEDPRSSDDENSSAGSTWQFDLQMSLLRTEHWWHSEANDSSRLCFEQFTRYIALQTSKYSTHFTYWISPQGKRWLAVQEGNKGLWLPLWTPHRVQDQGLGCSVGRAWALCAEPLQELEKAPLPGTQRARFQVSLSLPLANGFQVWLIN